MPGKVNGLTLAYGAMGGILLWSGIKGWTISDTFRNLLSGKTPTTNEEPINTSESSTSSADSGTNPASPPAPGDTSAHSAAAASYQAMAKMLALAAGHPDWITGTQWADWVSLWNQESGWSATAQNPGSGAYGIAQANPYTKMPKSAWPPADGGQANPQAQITWGIDYIASTYGDPETAWAHEVAQGWY